MLHRKLFKAPEEKISIFKVRRVLFLLWGKVRDALWEDRRWRVRKQNLRLFRVMIGELCVLVLAA